MLRLKTQATVEPVTLTEVKAWLNITVTDWDTKLTSGIVSARTQIERLIGMSLAAVTYEYEIQDYSESYIELPYPKIASITSVTNTDSSGTVTTVNASDYKLIGSRLNYSGNNGMVTVTYLTAAPVANEFTKQMILKQVGYDYRNAFEPKGIDEEVLRISKLITINNGY